MGHIYAVSDLAKIRAGLYLHEPTGRYVVRTDGWEGRRSRNLTRWEHAEFDGHDVLIDGLGDLYRTRREAVDALICAACSHFHSGPCLCPDCGRPAETPGGTCGRHA